MPAERVAMRQAREIIRLKFSANIPTREIAQRLGLAPSTVRESLKRFEVSGLGWPLPEGISESELGRHAPSVAGADRQTGADGMARISSHRLRPDVGTGIFGAKTS